MPSERNTARDACDRRRLTIAVRGALIVLTGAACVGVWWAVLMLPMFGGPGRGAALLVAGSFTVVWALGCATMVWFAPMNRAGGRLVGWFRRQNEGARFALVAMPGFLLLVAIAMVARAIDRWAATTALLVMWMLVFGGTWLATTAYTRDNDEAFYCKSCGFERPQQRTARCARCPECGNDWWASSDERMQNRWWTKAGAQRGKPRKRAWRAAVGIALLLSATVGMPSLIGSGARLVTQLRSNAGLIARAMAGSPYRGDVAWAELATRTLTAEQELLLFEHALAQRTREGWMAEAACICFERAMADGRLPEALMDAYFAGTYTDVRLVAERGVVGEPVRLWIDAHKALSQAMPTRAHDVGVLFRGLSFDGGATWTFGDDEMTKMLFLGSVDRYRGEAFDFASSRLDAVGRGRVFEWTPSELGEHEVLAELWLVAVTGQVDLRAPAFDASGEPTPGPSAVWSRKLTLRTAVTVRPAEGPAEGPEAGEGSD
jgi:hypothetical protein